MQTCIIRSEHGEVWRVRRQEEVCIRRGFEYRPEVHIRSNRRPHRVSAAGFCWRIGSGVEIRAFRIHDRCLRGSLATTRGDRESWNGSPPVNKPARMVRETSLPRATLACPGTDQKRGYPAVGGVTRSAAHARKHEGGHSCEWPPSDGVPALPARRSYTRFTLPELQARRSGRQSPGTPAPSPAFRAPPPPEYPARCASNRTSAHTSSRSAGPQISQGLPEHQTPKRPNCTRVAAPQWHQSTVKWHHCNL